MLIYRCDMCDRVLTFLSVPTALYCEWCGGTLILHDEGNDPNRASTKNVFDLTEDATQDYDLAHSEKRLNEAHEDFMATIRSVGAKLDRLALKRGIVVDPRALRWLRVLCEHPRLLILGAQGMGKSCFAFWLLEIMRYRGCCYVYRLPEEGKSLIPPWIGILQELDDAPPGSIILIDEAHLICPSRESQTKANRKIARFMSLARQKDISLIFVAHESRHLEKNITSGINILVLKKPAPLQVELDRSFLRSYLLKAQHVFEGKSDTASKSFSYVCFSPSGFEGVLENAKPSFWTEKLSHIFASGHLGKIERPAQQLSSEEKKKRARKLRDYFGYSYGEIAKEIGMGKATVFRWLKENAEGETSQ